MRLLHTSDWHLGATLGGHPRDSEHQRFLAWLLETLKAQAVDVLLITGDIFDTANPPASAQRLYYDFLARCYTELPALTLVIIGGNHDSASRLDAPADLLNHLRVRVVGGVTTQPDGQPDVDRMLVPLGDATGKVAAWCVAVPFLRPSDVSAAEEFCHGVRALYARLFEVARQRRRLGQALVATGHAFMVGGQLSDTERPIQCGHLYALPADIFPEDAAYVALGHLHRAQCVANRPHVRYSGSPFPLSFTERHYAHQVVLIELEGEHATRIEPLPVPPMRDLLRIPQHDAAPLDQVLNELRQLPTVPTASDKLPPLVEVHVRVDRPQPTLKEDIEGALRGVWANLARIEVVYPQQAQTSSLLAANNHTSPTPEALFAACYRAKHGCDPSDTLQQTFHTLLQETLSKVTHEDSCYSRPSSCFADRV
jgi:exonuclease SbcD